MAQTGYRHAGDIDLQTLKLISASNQVIDLSELYVQVDIYQALFENFIRAEIVISDSVALFQTLGGGFTGGEMIAISYKSNSEDIDYKQHIFVVHKLSNRTKTKDENELYMLECASLELYQDIGFKVSRSYRNQLFSDMIDNLTHEFLYNDRVKQIYSNIRKSSVGVNIDKVVDISPSSGNQNWVVPMVSPTSAIGQIAGEADNDIGYPYFVFYEDAQGFKFRDINVLAGQEPIGQYIYQVKNFGEDSDYYKINSYTVNKQGSFYDTVTRGMFKSRTLSLDIARRSWNADDTIYENENQNFAKLQDVASMGKVGEDTLPALFVMTSRISHEQDSRFSGEGVLPLRKSRFIGKRNTFITNLTNTEVEVEIPGDSELLVGCIVQLRFPSSSNTDDQYGVDDAQLSGKYLVSRVRHKISGDNFVTVMRCVKDNGINTNDYYSAISQEQPVATPQDASAPLGSVEPISPPQSVGSVSGTAESVMSPALKTTKLLEGEINIDLGSALVASKILPKENIFGLSIGIGDGGIDGLLKGKLPELDIAASLPLGSTDLTALVESKEFQQLKDISEGKITETTLKDGVERVIKYVEELNSHALVPKK